MKRAAAFGVLLSVVGPLACEPSPRLSTQVRLPPNVAIEATAIRVEMSTSEAAGPNFEALGTIADHQHEPTPLGYKIMLMTRIGNRVPVRLILWVDNNGNDVRDAGDWAGELAPAPFDAVDPGGCASNVNNLPDVTLTRVQN